MKRSIFKSKEYFDNYIINLQSSYDKMFQKIKNEEIKNSKLNWAKNNQLQMLYRLLVVKYSRGEKIKNLIPIYDQIVNGITNEKWDENYVKFTYTKHKKIIKTNQLSLNFHPLLINILCIGVLIDTQKLNFEKIKNFLNSFNIEHKLFDILLNYKIPNHFIRESRYKLIQYKKLNELINKNNMQPKDIINYHTKWYQSLSSTFFNWKDSTIKGNLFYGYWCFESAALSKIHNLDISCLYQNIYFPTDLFKNDGSNFKYDVSLENVLLINIDKTMNDVGEFWKIRNSSNEILKSRRILQNICKKRYGEVESQITSYFNKLENYTFQEHRDKILRNKPIVFIALYKLLNYCKIEHSNINFNNQSSKNNSKLNIWTKFKKFHPFLKN